MNHIENWAYKVSLQFSNAIRFQKATYDIGVGKCGNFNILKALKKCNMKRLVSMKKSRSKILVSLIYDHFHSYAILV